MYARRHTALRRNEAQPRGAEEDANNIYLHTYVWRAAMRLSPEGLRKTPTGAANTASPRCRNEAQPRGAEEAGTPAGRRSTEPRRNEAQPRGAEEAGPLSRDAPINSRPQ